LAAVNSSTLRYSGGVVVVHLGEFDARRGRDACFLSYRCDLFSSKLLESLPSRPNIGDLDPRVGRGYIIAAT
jgi:hypothetical protein